MPKNLFQDMVKMKNQKAQQKEMRELPRKGISIKRVIEKEPSLQRNMRELKKPEKKYFPPDREPVTPRDFGGDRRGSHYGLWFVAGVCILFLFFALSYLLAGATVNIIPKTQDVNLNETLSAIKDSNPDGLSFELVVISGEDTKNVIAGDKKDVSLNAKGNIYIYNSGDTAQKLSANTKLTGSNGKIYQTDAAIVVPAAGSDGLPGKIEVGIHGADAGADFNSDPLDFKILGFKGTAKDDKFYGRSQGSISGGFVGTSPIIADADKENAFNELKNTLQEKLIQKATDQIPDGYILFKDAAFLKIDSEDVDYASSTDSSSLPVKVKGTLYGFLLSEKELTQKIAKNKIPGYDDSPIYISNIKDLTFALTDKDISFADVQNINFVLSGSAKVVWKFDSAKLAESLLGKSKSDFSQILAQYPNVESGQADLNPVWNRSFPNRIKSIKVNVNYPK